MSQDGKTSILSPKEVAIINSLPFDDLRRRDVDGLVATIRVLRRENARLKRELKEWKSYAEYKR